MKWIKRFERYWFICSLLIAGLYALLYGECEIGVSPFHISDRMPELDWLILVVTVIVPALLGIVLAVMSGVRSWRAPMAIGVWVLAILLSVF